MILKSKKRGYSKNPSTTLQKIKEPPFYKKSYIRLYLLWIVMACLVTLFIMPSLSIRVSPLEVGNISSKDIKATMDFSLEDHETTVQRRREAEQSVLPVYDYNDKLLVELVGKITEFFTKLRNFSELKSSSLTPRDPNTPMPDEEGVEKKLKPEKEISPKEREKLWQQEWEKFAQEKGLSLDYKQYLALEETIPAKDLENEIIKIITEILTKGILSSHSFSFNEPERGFIKRNLSSQTEVKVKDISGVLDLNAAQKLFDSKIKALFPKNDKVANIITKTFQGHITTNLSFNLSETDKKIEDARSAVKPAFFQIKKGEMIIREGERAKKDQVEKLNELMKLKQETNTFQTVLGLFIIVALILMMLYIFLRRFTPKHATKFGNLLLIALSILITTGIMRMLVFIAHALPSTIPAIPQQSYYYAFPFATASVIIAILLDIEIAVIVAVIVGILAGILLNRELSFFMIAFLGSLGGIYFLSYRKNRSNIVKSGLIVALINLGVIVPLNMIQGTLFSLQGFFNAFFGFLGGIMASALVMAFVSFLEPLFHLTTDVTLLELLNLNNPLLRRLAMEAPGTYHHCIVVANLAEAACESINANSLIARVASYYHDIGKIKMPRYYIENQMNMKNEHENLSPSMSGLILISHIKDGVELGKKFKLNQSIIDIIKQHHGTSLIRFFYMKAKDLQSNEGKDVKEEDYRYPGPKPQTKEAGIVMLADAVEATSRTLNDPRASRIQGMIQNTINNIFKDGQLDECELTLKDLHQIANSFNRILMGIFHPRIVYPGTNVSEETKKEKGGDLYSKSSKEAKTTPTGDKEGSGKNIKRLGIKNPGSEYNIRK